MGEKLELNEISSVSVCEEWEGGETRIDNEGEKYATRRFLHVADVVNSYLLSTKESGQCFSVKLGQVSSVSVHVVLLWAPRAEGGASHSES